MRTRSVVWLACLALAACSDGGSSTPPTTGTIAFHNASTHPFGRVFVEPSPATLLVTQRNAGDVAPGATLAVSGLEPGTWDCFVYVYDQGTRFLAPYDAVPIDAGETVALTVSDADFLSRIEVTNAATSDITGLFLGLQGSWGSNMVSTPIAPGTALSPNWHLPAGSFDLRCDFADSTQSIGTIVLEPLVLARVTCPFP